MSERKKKMLSVICTSALMVTYGKIGANTAKLCMLTVLWKAISCSTERKCFMLICKKKKFTEISILGQITQILGEYCLQGKDILQFL